MKIKKIDAERVFEVEDVKFTLKRPDYKDAFTMFQDGGTNLAALADVTLSKITKIEGLEYEDEPEKKVQVVDVPYRLINVLCVEYTKWITETLGVSEKKAEEKKEQ